MTVTKFIFHQNQSRTPTNDSLLYLKIKKEEVEGNNSVLYDVTNVDDNIFETTDHMKIPRTLPSLRWVVLLYVHEDSHSHSTVFTNNCRLHRNCSIFNYKGEL